MEDILQKANHTLNTLEASIFDLQHMQDDIQKLLDKQVEELGKIFSSKEKEIMEV